MAGFGSIPAAGYKPPGSNLNPNRWGQTPPRFQPPGQHPSIPSNHPAYGTVLNSSGTGRMPMAPTAAQTAPTNSATTQTPGAGAGPQQPSFDSTYFANVAANQNRVNGLINGLNLRGSLADSTLQNTLAQLAQQEPQSQLRLEQAANRGGGLFSSVYNTNLGNLTQGFTDRQASAQTGHDNQLQQLAAQISSLQSGIPLFNDQQAAESASRLAALAAANPASGQQVPGGGGAGRAGGAGAGAAGGWAAGTTAPEHAPGWVAGTSHPEGRTGKSLASKIGPGSLKGFQRPGLANSKFLKGRH